MTADEFAHGVWWVPDDRRAGWLRPAHGSECAAEILRLRAEVTQLQNSGTGLTQEKADG